MNPEQELLLKRSIEEDTRIISTQFIEVQSHPVLLEQWSWEGITGMSAVFLTQHVAGLDDSQLLQLLESAVNTNIGSTTIKKEPVYTFVNYGFRG